MSNPGQPVALPAGQRTVGSVLRTNNAKPVISPTQDVARKVIRSGHAMNWLIKQNLRLES
jgi:hypothetical protein